jgi:evolutionarily conserved signaling intermediate in Toll pathway
MYRPLLFRAFLASFTRTDCSVFSQTRTLRLSAAFRKDQDQSGGEEDKEVVKRSLFDVKEKNKNTYIDMIRKFNERSVQKRGQVEFVYAAMNHMDEFGVSKDLSVYKALIETFPKGKMIPRNIFQSEFQHYPKHQQCAIDLLEKMELNGLSQV